MNDLLKSKDDLKIPWFLEQVLVDELNQEVPLTVLDTLANSRTSNEGAGNYHFFHNDDEIDMEKNAGKKLVELLESEDDSAGEFIVECYEIKAARFNFSKAIPI